MSEQEKKENYLATVRAAVIQLTVDDRNPAFPSGFPTPTLL